MLVGTTACQSWRVFGDIVVAPHFKFYGSPPFVYYVSAELLV